MSGDKRSELTEGATLLTCDPRCEYVIESFNRTLDGSVLERAREYISDNAPNYWTLHTFQMVTTDSVVVVLQRRLDAGDS